MRPFISSFGIGTTVVVISPTVSPEYRWIATDRILRA
jgi:hypothetical protein